MIKKLHLIILVFVFGALNLNAQCIPDVSLTIPGIYPDSATGLPSGIEGIPYSEDIQARVLTDTTLNGLPVLITNITLTSVTGLPPGLSYACTPSNCIFPGGSNGCILISGTPTAAGVYPITVELTANGTIFGIGVPPQVTTVDYYSIVIDAPTGIANDISDIKFEMLPLSPNPASNYTDITFTTPLAGNFKLSVFNLLGKEVLVQNIKAAAGMNSKRIYLNTLSPGVYLLSFDNGSAVLTKRIIVSGK